MPASERGGVTVHVPYPGLPDFAPKPQPPPRRGLPHPFEPVRPQEAEFDPFQRLYRRRIIMLGNRLDDAAANDLVAKLVDLDAEDPEAEIILRLNCPGGSYSAMLAVYDAMDQVRAGVRTVCVGQAEGPAAVLLAAGAPGRRVMLPTAYAVLNQPTVEQPRTADATDATIERDKAAWVRDQVEAILAARTGQSKSQIHNDIERPKLLNAEDSVAYGLADEVQSRAAKSQQ
ncbi:MAG TPA: ATP-dependent Clp protease proteolytic subunit [Pseudonocardiaceae bacterium]|nr:ATP-dependent Clp protease proteolytic subunit [Pseudonocardiaceae bacterium]